MNLGEAEEMAGSEARGKRKKLLQLQSLLEGSAQFGGKKSI